MGEFMSVFGEDPTPCDSNRQWSINPH